MPRKAISHADYGESAAPQRVILEHDDTDSDQRGSDCVRGDPIVVIPKDGHYPEICIEAGEPRR